jgi:Tol biopolymer transport system component/polyisoprenoid-binding protein YceI
MRSRFKRLRLWQRLVIAGIVGLVALFAGGYGYFAIRTADAPAPAALGAAPDLDPDAPLDGRWELPNENAGFVGYRVREVLALIPAPNDAVGRTSEVEGSMTIEGGIIEAVRIEVVMATLQSDEPSRDEAVRDDALRPEFPTGTFEVTEPIELPAPTRGEAFSIVAPGELTLNGITKSVEFPLDARWNGDTFEVAGQLEVERADYSLSISNVVGLRISDRGTIELELTFVREGSQATPKPASEESGRDRRLEPRAGGDGRRRVALRHRGRRDVNIFAVNVDGTELTRLSNPAERVGYWSVDEHPVASPDGRFIAYSHGLESRNVGEPPRIIVAGINGSTARPITNAGFAAMVPAWSPDGRRIAFQLGTRDSGQIWTMAPDGSRARAVTDSFDPVSDPSWSPDGATIAYSSFIQGSGANEDLYLIGANGAGGRRLTRGPAYDFSPSWSPDGRRIAFARDGDIYSMQPDGSRLRRLTSGPARDASPAWSPDGDRIAFARADERGRSFSGPFRVVIMDADGSNQARVPLPGEATWPSWIP